MNNTSHKDLVRNFIVSNLMKKQENKNITDSDNIIEEGIIDSLGLMKLINYIEDNFSLKIDDEDLTPDNFESIDIISSFIEKMLKSQKQKS